MVRKNRRQKAETIYGTGFWSVCHGWVLWVLKYFTFLMVPEFGASNLNPTVSHTYRHRRNLMSAVGRTVSRCREKKQCRIGLIICRPAAAVNIFCIVHASSPNSIHFHLLWICFPRATTGCRPTTNPEHLDGTHQFTTCHVTNAS